MRPTWWQRRTPAQIGITQLVVVAAYGVLLPVLIRADNHLLTGPALASAGSVMALVSSAGGVGRRAQGKLLRQAYKEMRIPPGADMERWRVHLRTRVAQHDPRWSRISAVWTGVVASVAVPFAFRLPLWGCAIGFAAVALVDLVSAGRRGTTEPGWLDDTRFLLIQLDAQDGIRDP